MNKKRGCGGCPPRKKRLPLSKSDGIAIEGVLTARVGGGEGQQRHMARALDRGRQAALVPRAGARAPARQDFAPVGDIALQALDVFVIGDAYLVDAEAAHLAAGDELTTATGAVGAAARPAP